MTTTVIPETEVLVEVLEFTWENIGERFWDHLTVDVPTLLCVIVLTAVAWATAHIVFWCIWISGKFICGSCIRKNEKIRRGHITNHRKKKKTNYIGHKLNEVKKKKKKKIENFQHNPFDFSDFTTSRLYAYALGISTLYFFLSVCGILYFFEFYLVLLVKLTTGMVVIVWTLMSRTEWMYSYLLRYYILYYDYVRIGDIILYKKNENDEKEYKVKAFHPLITILRRQIDVKVVKKLLPISEDQKTHIKEIFLDIPVPNTHLLDPTKIGYNFVQYT